MRYVELNDGSVILAPRRGIGHGDMIRMCGVGPHQVSSAGFVSMGYTRDEPLSVYGDSINLNKKARADIQIPEALFGGMRGWMVVFTQNKKLLDGLDNVEEATWGMTRESHWGEVMPVYAPLHSKSRMNAADYVTD